MERGRETVALCSAVSIRDSAPQRPSVICIQQATIFHISQGDFGTV
jgi:hypothetical protein